jgi:hypothetical protein
MYPKKRACLHRLRNPLRARPGAINNSMKHLVSFELFEARRNPDLDDRVLFRDLGLLSSEPDRMIDGWYPETKDLQRAYDLLRKPNRLGGAESMAKLITDRGKLVRRMKAIIRACVGQEPEALDGLLSPFVRRAEALGFTENQIARLIDWRPN